MLNRYLQHLEDTCDVFPAWILLVDVIVTGAVFLVVWFGYWIGDFSLFEVVKYTLAIPSPLHIAAAIPFAIWLMREWRS